MAIATSNWIFEGRPTYAEFQETFAKDAAGKLVAGSQQLQKRNVYTFSRYCIEPAVSTMPDTAVGDQAAPSAISAYQGSVDMNAGTINTGETQIYVCTKDDYGTDGVGPGWVLRSQTWEMRGEWADYTWPTAP